MNLLHRLHPRKFPLAGMLFGLAAFAVPGADSATAQNCFFIFCDDGPGGSAQPPWEREPGWRAEPGWQREPGWQSPGWQQAPDRDLPGEPAWRYSGRPDPVYFRIYAEAEDEPFPVPALRLSDVDPAYLRKSVYYPTDEAAGTIIIDPQQHFLYFVEGGGRAIRYGVGVGRTGFGWSGIATVHNKREWPDWYPPRDMFRRQPEIRRVMSELPGGLGMPGGPRNPLGARALYLWQGDKDTLYRIHGTVEPWTIGTNVSSGCIRMINQDVIDLYDRVSAGAKVIVLSARASGWARRDDRDSIYSTYEPQRR